jgi:hypothetical protein
VPGPARTGDVVIAMADGYGSRDVEPFLRSLRRSGYDGDVVVLTTVLGGDLSRLASELRVELVSLDSLVRTSRRLRRFARSAVFHLQQRGVHVLPVLAAMARAADSASRRRLRAQARLVAHAYPVALSRYAYYAAYLASYQRPLRTVVLSDVRDVVFQSDPREGLQSGLHVFTEDPSVRLGNCAYNRRWLANGYGEATARAMADEVIICSGVTVGDGDAVRRYLDDMLDGFMQLRQVDTGTDQATHNVLVRSGRLAVASHDNDEGPVLTMGHVPDDALLWDRDQRLVNAQGRPYSIVHQYDRHLSGAVTVSPAGVLRPRRSA